MRLRREIEVRCCILEKIVLSVVVLTVDSAYRALMPTSVAVRAGIWLRTTQRKEVRLEVILSLGIIHRMQQQSSLIRGTGSTPLRPGRSRRSPLMWSHVYCKYS